jgi:hypothetical protein
VNEQIEQLEAELSAMRPRNASARLVDRLSAAVSERIGRSWSDRVLVFAMSVGALAACIIISLLISEPTYVPPAPGKAITVRAAGLPDHAYAFARASSVWRDGIN